MSAPLRLNVDPDATFRARDLLAAAARPRSMAPAERARSLAHVHKLASSPAAAGAAAGLFASAPWKVAAVTVVVAAFALGASVGTTRTSPSTAARDRAPLSEPALSPPPDVPSSLPERGVPLARPDPAQGRAISTPATSPARVLPVAPAEVPTKSEAPVGSDSLQAEMRLLDAASLRIKTNPVAAFDIVDLHARNFPRGHLVAEREVLAVEALQRLDRGGEARARAQTFLAQSPDSIYRERIAEILGPSP